MNPKDSSDISLPIALEGAPEGPRDFAGEFDDNYDTTTGSVSPEDPAYKPYPFALRPAPDDKIHIYFGVLVHQINRMVFNSDGLVSQTGLSNPQTIIPSNLSAGENRYKFYELGWRGDVYLYWETDSSGGVTSCDLRGPDAPTAQALPNVNGGKFFVKLGNVAAGENDTSISALDQNISTDVYWLTAFGVQEDESDSSSSSSDSGSTTDSGSTSVSDSGSDKSTAIVPMGWHDKGYGALFTMESNEVLFEFVMRDVPLEGANTVARIDDRFLAVCEPDSMAVTGVAGDRAGSVGAAVEKNNVILSAWPLSFLRPSKVTLKLTGVRKGFKHLDMPERSKEQFIANEKFINSAYPKG
jgi:hypothetical protein